jgi:hypothetical protein
MSYYDNGYQYPWEIWIGLALAALALYLCVRVTRKMDRRRAAHPASGAPPRPQGPRSPRDTTDAED